jgi:hypothetical protein
MINIEVESSGRGTSANFAELRICSKRSPDYAERIRLEESEQTGTIDIPSRMMGTGQAESTTEYNQVIVPAFRCRLRFDHSGLRNN